MRRASASRGSSSPAVAGPFKMLEPYASANLARGMISVLPAGTRSLPRALRQASSDNQSRAQPAPSAGCISIQPNTAP